MAKGNALGAAGVGALAGSLSRVSVHLHTLLSDSAELVHRTRRTLFEKRIVAVADRKHVLYRFAVPRHARRLADLLREAERLGVPMQRCEQVWAGWGDVLRHRGAWVAVSYEEGRTFTPAQLNEDAAGSLATALGRLHSIVGVRPGPLFGYRPFARSLAGEVTADVTQALRYAGSHAADEKAAMVRWLDANGAFLKGRTSFHLLHGDLLAKNVLLREDGDAVCLVDYELATFDHAGFELGAALLRFFGGRNRALIPAFLDRYLATCSEDVAADWEVHAPYFLVASALRLARTRVRRREMLLRRGESEAAKAQIPRIDSFSARAFALMRAHEGGARRPFEMLTAPAVPRAAMPGGAAA